MSICLFLADVLRLDFVSDLEQDSLSLVWCSTDGAGLMFGVAQREALKSH